MKQKRQVTSNRLNVNAGIMSWYVKELTKLTKQMTTECTKELANIYKKLGYQVEFAQDKKDLKTLILKESEKARIFINSNYNTGADESISSQVRIALNELQKKYGDKFNERSKELVKQLLKKTNRYSNMQINNALKDMLGDKAKGFALVGSAISPEKSEVMKAILFENVSLIKSIPDEYFKQITGAVARSIENGYGVKGLSKELEPMLSKFGKKAKRRADLIAQDQTRKAFTSLNIRNFNECGIKKFKWVHSGGSREPRKYHMDVLNGQVFDLDTGAPNETGKTPDYIYPGQEPYCRCIMQAVLDFED